MFLFLVAVDQTRVVDPVFQTDVVAKQFQHRADVVAIGQQVASRTNAETSFKQDHTPVATSGISGAANS